MPSSTLDLYRPDGSIILYSMRYFYVVSCLQVFLFNCLVVSESLEFTFLKEFVTLESGHKNIQLLFVVRCLVLAFPFGLTLISDKIDTIVDFTGSNISTSINLIIPV